MRTLNFRDRLLIAVLPAILLCSPLLAESKKGLAKVAILTYEDETGTKNFGYMPGSLTEAIDKSLQQRFEYEREEPQKSEAARKSIKSKGALSAREAAQYCIKNDVQILVFGKFTYDAAKKQIVVDTFISLGTEDKFRHLAERRNPTDASIFTLADKVADDIVREMTSIAKEQQGAEKKTGKPKAEDKLELKKTVPVVWAFKNYSINLGLGVVSPQSDLKSVYSPSGTLALSANRLIWRGLYAGIFAQFFKLNTKDGSGSSMSSSLTAIPLVANVGYALFFWSDRWRLNTEIGAGYYGAKFEVKASSGNSGEATIYTRSFSNPALRGAVSLQWLLFQPLSLGLEFSYLVLTDKNQPSAQAASLMLSVGYVF